MTEHKNIICLVVDRLHSGYLGAYGNTWISTPEIDRLAAESYLFDRAAIDSPRLDDLYRSYWQAGHAIGAPALSHDELAAQSLPQRLAAAGYFTALLSDEPAVSRHDLAESFARRDHLACASMKAVAESIEETELARFFAAAAEQLGELRPPFCLWLHAGSLGQTWDAPLEFRNRYADEDDPAPPTTATVPCRRVPRDFDPDEMLGIMHAYAGQVSLLDLCVGSLLAALAESPFAGDTLFVLTSARGFPLGEHQRLGPCDEALYGELTQIPWLLRFPDGMGQSDRTQALVQPPDLHATLADWCGLPAYPIESSNSGRSPAAGCSLLPLASGTADAVRDRACIVAPPSEQAIITPAWYLRMNTEEGTGASGQATGDSGRHSNSADSAGDSGCELFVKPDDRFEVNEVADRCPDRVAELREAFAQFQRSCQSPESAELPPLPEILLSGME